MEPEWTINSIAKIAEGPRRDIVTLLTAILTHLEGEAGTLGFVPMLWAVLDGETVHIRQIGEQDLLSGSPYHDDKLWPGSVISDMSRMDEAAYPHYRASAWVRSRTGIVVRSLREAQRQGRPADAAIIMMSHVDCREYANRVPDVWFFCWPEELAENQRLVFQHDYRAVLAAGLRGND